MRLSLRSVLLVMVVVICCLSSGVSAAGRRIRGTKPLSENDEAPHHRVQEKRGLMSKGGKGKSTSASTDIGQAGGARQPLPVRPVPAPAPPQSYDIVETIIRQGGLQTLIKLLFTAGLVDDLKATGPFTLFAPRNQALPSGEALADFVVSEPLSELQSVLTYHVVPGIVRSSDLVDGAKVTTLQGETVTISLTNGPMVNNARIVRSDIVATNGVIHVIDNLLMPF